MNIRFILPPSAGLNPGGVQRQAVETKRALETLGHHVSWSEAGHYVPLTDVDLVHLFIASPETWPSASLLKKWGVPFVVSPVTFFTRSPTHYRRAISLSDGLMRWVWGAFTTELQMRRDVCAWASHLLPNTQAEMLLVRDAFKVKTNKMTVIANGADVQRFTTATPDVFHSRFPQRDFLLFVGDAGSSRKNLYPFLRVYRTLKNPPQLVILGPLGDDKDPLSKEIRKIIDRKPFIHWIGPVDPDDPLLASAYAAAKGFVMPSLFETPGIAAIEAALAGCPLLITRNGGTLDTFGKDAFYLNPTNKKSMYHIVDRFIRELGTPEMNERVERLRKRMMAFHDWSAVGLQTEAVYRKVLEGT